MEQTFQLIVNLLKIFYGSNFRTFFRGRKRGKSRKYKNQIWLQSQKTPETGLQQRGVGGGGRFKGWVKVDADLFLKTPDGSAALCFLDFFFFLKKYQVMSPACFTKCQKTHMKDFRNLSIPLYLLFQTAYFLQMQEPFFANIIFFWRFNCSEIQLFRLFLLNTSKCVGPSEANPLFSVKNFAAAVCDLLAELSSSTAHTWQEVRRLSAEKVERFCFQFRTEKYKSWRFIIQVKLLIIQLKCWPKC